MQLPAKISTTLSSRHQGHQSPLHHFEHVLHYDISGRGCCVGHGRCVWRDLGGDVEMRSNFLAGNRVEFRLKSGRITRSKGSIGFPHRHQDLAAHKAHAPHNYHAHRYYNGAHARSDAIGAPGAENGVVLC